VAVRVRAGDHAPAKLLDLFDRVDGYITRPGNDDLLAVKIQSAGLQHLLHEEDGAIAGRLPPDLRAAPSQALSSEDAGLVAVGDALVLAEHIADLALPDADVARRDVRIFAEMAVKLSHERLAEPHDLHFGAPLGIEIGPALGAADGHACQSVLERLLEAEELDDPQIDAGVEPE